RFLLFLLLFVLLSLKLHSNENNKSTLHTIEALEALKNSQEMLEKEIKLKSRKIKRLSADKKQPLEVEIAQLTTQLNEIKTKFNNIATGIDKAKLQPKEDQKKSSLNEDFKLLLKPLVESAKEATKELRQKAELQEEVAYYKLSQTLALKAYANIEELLKSSKDKALKKELKPLKKYWSQQLVFLNSQLNASQHQIEHLEQNSDLLSQSPQESTKTFFEKRGLFLLEGFIAFLGVLIVMKMVHWIIQKLFYTFHKPSRHFSLRLLDLTYRLSTIILAVVVPMGVFYFEEDWFLFSMGILILLGMLWTFRNLISKFWQQARLFLNIGSVREDERIYYQDLPWRVKHINIFTTLENPVSGVCMRLPIESLVGLVSRPIREAEPWFPCKIEDWVVLSDGFFGQVVGISLEFIELQDLSKGHKMYQILDFLSHSPLNLSTDFRIVETIGISYNHQKESTNLVVEQLKSYIMEQMEKEGYLQGVKKLNVQFVNAGDFSLNIDVIANFRGDMAPLYKALRRHIGRWCVDACTHYHWEIPFPQLTIHQPVA
ncbi:MAG: hypothetical protein U9N49_01405, partial [Campylobacterota bacterium]|nr:hypothetical protein [Campylobacterota bacterium]